MKRFRPIETYRRSNPCSTGSPPKRTVSPVRLRRNRIVTATTAWTGSTDHVSGGQGRSTASQTSELLGSTGRLNSVSNHFVKLSL